MSVREKPEKQKKKKKRRKKRYLLKFILVVIFCVALYFFLSSNIFDIQKITVSNNNYYTKEQVIGIAKLKLGENIFAADMSAAKEKLLLNPYVKTVKVSRKLPATVVITIDERKEFASVPYGKEFVLIDKEGMVLRKTEVEPALPLLVGMTMKNIEPGEPLEVEENSVLSDTLRLVDEMGEHELYFKKIDISNVIVRAYVFDQLICEGTPENILKSLEPLKEVLYGLYAQGIERGVLKVGSDQLIPFNPVVD
ncbi:MAG: FtsQ-type POTRA domain-containing protein [Anaerovorax sp.]